MRKVLISFFLIIIFIGNIIVYGEDLNNKNIRILFTHDLHDRIDSYKVSEGSKVKELGGYERLSTLIKTYKNKSTVVLDAGDYSMGTLFQTIYSSHSPSLKLLGYMGYDAVTIGNHEFDFRADGLRKSLEGVSKSNLPEIVVSNINFNINKDNKDYKDVKKLEKTFSEVGVKDYTIIERNGVKLGIFGVLGDEAISNAPMAGVDFYDYIEKSKEIVKELEDKCDMIICLSHSGTWEDSKKSEDEILAREVPEIDVIISGHTHSQHNEPIIVGDTIIGSSGYYGKNLGFIDLEMVNNKWELKEYKLIEVNDKVEKDSNITKQIEEYKDIIQDRYLNKFGFIYDEKLANTDYTFKSHSLIGENYEEEPLANLIGDSYIHTIKEIEGDNYETITASIVPAGTIRDTFFKGDVDVSDIFNVASLGIGPDNISGYPLISVYLTGEDLKKVVEVDASIGPKLNFAQLYISGLEYRVNPNRNIFNKVIDVNILNEDMKKESIEEDRLYRVVGVLYTGQMLSIVGDASYGLINIVPRDRNGKEIENLEEHIVYEGNMEVKEWYALANYIKSFPEENSISKFPNKYRKAEGRKVVVDDRSFKAIVEKPNKITKKLMGLGIGAFLILALIIRALLKWLKRKDEVRTSRRR